MLFFAFTTTAQPRFAAIFADHVVLQRNREIDIWGFGAAPGQKLEVALGSSLVVAKVSRTGNWTARFPARSKNLQGVNLTLFVDGDAQAKLIDVVIGDVWLAAGQSNMQYPVSRMVKHLPQGQAWAITTSLPLIRMRRIHDPIRPDPSSNSDDIHPGNWVPMSRQSVTKFSAVAAAFARSLSARINAPIGIIDVSWGGKPIEPFIPREAFRTPLLKRILRLSDEDALEKLQQMPGGVIIRNAEGHPGAIYNARMAPLTNFGLKGFLWYQAESNCGRGEDPRFYRFKQQAMIEGWRAAWRDSDLPCYYVQLPSFAGATGWVRMREEQRLAQSVPHTAMAVTIDVRGQGIHPPDKLSVGRRLAHLAMAETYHWIKKEVRGPTYASHRIKGNSVHVRFQNAESGLMVGFKPSVPPAEEFPGNPLLWFEVADADGRWHTAEARIEAGEVIVVANGVKQPVAVRYACAPKPQGGNLYNRDGYPASPFCTDLKLLPWDDHGAK
ncbi:MAG: sialate O-acetylesterase [Limisphaerales bacterium]